MGKIVKTGTRQVLTVYTKMIHFPTFAFQPQKFSRLRVKANEAKKQELIPEKPEVEEIGVEAVPCDSALYDCEGCAIPKQARNCRVKYFKDQVSIQNDH